MPDRPLLAAAQAFRAELLAGERARAVRLVNAYGRVYRQLQDAIQALAEQIAGLDHPAAADVQELATLRALRTQVEERVTAFGGFADAELREGASQAIAQGLGHWEQLTLLAFPEVLRATVGGAFMRLHPDAVETMIGFLGNDSPLTTSLTRQLGPAVANAVADKLISGVALGLNPRATAAIIRNELGQGLTWSLNTTRTAQLWAYREANRAAMVANQAITPGWTWLAALDDRTCLSCVAMNGTHHAAAEVLNDHHSGRCVAVPETVSWQSLGIDLPETGAQVESGEDWFGRQPEATQQAMMGPGMYDAWRAGRFDVQDLSQPYQDPVYGEMLREASLKDLLGPRARHMQGRGRLAAGG